MMEPYSCQNSPLHKKFPAAHQLWLKIGSREKQSLEEVEMVDGHLLPLEAPPTTIKPFAFPPFFMHSVFPTPCHKTTPSLSNNLLKTYLVAKLMELEMEVWAVPDNLAASLMLSPSPPPFLAESTSLLLHSKMWTQGEKVLQLQLIFRQNCDESCSSKTA